MKVCLVCSHGGHLTEMRELENAFVGTDFFYVTYDSRRTRDLACRYRIPARMSSLWAMPFLFVRALTILAIESPDMLVSTGSEIAVPFFYLGRLLGVRTVYIESAARVLTPSATGKIVYPVAHHFLVQWPSLLTRFGAKSVYLGGLV